MVQNLLCRISLDLSHNRAEFHNFRRPQHQVHMLGHYDVRQQRKTMRRLTFVDSMHYDTAKRIVCQYWQTAMDTESYKPGATVVIVVFEFHTEDPTCRKAQVGYRRKILQ